MESRNFQLDAEWNIIHYPEKPLGFGVLIIGDERHFVDRDTSFWMQNEGKRIQLKEFQEAGYTIFNSNLYGKHWGSEKAVKLANRLYEYVMQKEILNEKIHVVAEGMGALAAIKLLKEMNGTIRSLILINPILSLKYHLELEKDHKFFYKKLVRELEYSYDANGQTLMMQLNQSEEDPLVDISIPIKIIQVLAGNRGYKQSQLLNILSKKWQSEKLHISISYIVPEKKQQMAKQMIAFFKKHEDI